MLHLLLNDKTNQNNDSATGEMQHANSEKPPNLTGQLNQMTTHPSNPETVHNSLSPNSQTIISTPSEWSGTSPSNGENTSATSNGTSVYAEQNKSHLAPPQPPVPHHQQQGFQFQPPQHQAHNQLLQHHIPYGMIPIQHHHGDHQHPSFPGYNQYQQLQPISAMIHSQPQQQSSSGNATTTSNASNVMDDSQKDLKRKKPSVTFPRKRALTACEKCRTKKVKCDNVRPICGSCSRTNSRCAYNDNQDAPAYDFASISILNKLDYLLKEMEQMKTGVSAKSPLSPLVADRLINITNYQWSICNWKVSTETVLNWPVFARNSIIIKRIPYFDFKKNIVQILSDFNEKNLPVSNSLSVNYEIVKDDVVENLAQYVNSYLDNVHSKSPFLDVNRLLLTVKYIENNNSDLIHHNESLTPFPIVIVCCALGVMATPITLSNLVDYQSSLIEKNVNGKFEKSYKILQFAQFLRENDNTLIPDNSLEKVQFSLLIGIYFMYILKPLKSFKHLNRATLTLLTYLQTSKASENLDEDIRRLQEKLYWTCFKYESEIRVELAPYVPPSTITNFPPPASFPSPPIIINENQHETEHTWYFFLTEIALRKLENQILDEIYTDLSSWDSLTSDDIFGIISKYLDSLNEVIQSLNPQIKQFLLCEEPSASMSSEPVMFIKTRIVSIKIILYRPLVYFLMHNPQNIPLVKSNILFAQAIADCVELGKFINPALGAHRHNGSWYYLRNAFLGTLLRYQFIKSGLDDAVEEVKLLLKDCIRLLAYWKDESIDLIRSIEVLKALLTDLYEDER